MRVLMFFIDGVALGQRKAENPFFTEPTPCLRKLLQGRPLVLASAGYRGDRASLVALDAVLGVAGLPQSATGQASIFTGQNAPRLLGTHLNGFPNQELRSLLAESGIFIRLRRRGYRCAFANAYRPDFFDLLRQGLPGNNYSCSTLITYYGGLTFRSLDDLREKQALFMDIDHTLLSQMEYGLPQITPETAGSRLAALSKEYDFTLFEYFLSDLAGHRGDIEEAARVVQTLDRFIGALTSSLDPAETLLIVTSDHGNLEDLAHREHTTTPVPALLIGSAAWRDRLMPRLHDLTDILPAILETLQGNDSEGDSAERSLGTL